MKGIKLIFVITLFIITSCGKHANKIADTYTGELTKDGVTVSTNTTIAIDEVDKNTARINSTEFDSYEVEVDKNRYFASKTYYSTTPNESLEVFDDGNIILIHNVNQEEFIFVGRRN